MIAKNTTTKEMRKALELTNKAFNNNVVFNRFDQQGKNIAFTLKTENSSKEGSKVSYSGRKTCAACWHVHGEFFDNLILKVNNKAIVISSYLEKERSKMFYNGSRDVQNNWQNIKQGTYDRPVYMSDLCNCDN